MFGLSAFNRLLERAINTWTAAWHARGRNIANPAWRNQREAVRQIQNIANRFRDAEGLEGMLEMIQQARGVHDITVAQRRKLARIMTECQNALNSIFHEYFELKRKLMEEVDNQLGHYGQTTRNLHGQYRYGTAEFFALQMNLAFATLKFHLEMNRNLKVNLDFYFRFKDFSNLNSNLELSRFKIS